MFIFLQFFITRCCSTVFTHFFIVLHQNNKFYIGHVCFRCNNYRFLGKNSVSTTIHNKICYNNFVRNKYLIKNCGKRQKKVLFLFNKIHYDHFVYINIPIFFTKKNNIIYIIDRVLFFFDIVPWTSFFPQGRFFFKKIKILWCSPTVLFFYLKISQGTPEK
jgi:hypothetical protein